MPARLADRIRGVRDQGHLVAHRHVEYHEDTPEITGVFCKLCGTKIIGHRAIGEARVVRGVDDRNTVLVHQPTRCAPLTGYTQILLQLDDGGWHVTHCCLPCRAGGALDDLAVLEAMYLADLEEMAESFQRSSAQTKGQSYLDRMAAKRVLGWAPDPSTF